MAVPVGVSPSVPRIASIKKKKEAVDEGVAYKLNEPTDSLLDTIQLADPDSFSHIGQLLTLGCILSIGSTENTLPFNYGELSRKLFKLSAIATCKKH